MPGNNNNEETKKMSSIPSKIIEAISSVYPEELLQNESCPSFSINNLNIVEMYDESKKKEVEKEYKIGNYLIKKTLGQGTFGKVKLGIYLPNKEKVAIKILEKDRIVEKDDEIRVKREFDMLAKFNHPNVILVAEIFESSDSYYSVMEYCQGGELFNYIVKNRRLSDEEASFFYFQLINGLEYLHSLGIVHRDLKPENLLLTSEHLLKIIDFGLSNYFKEGQKNLLSTPCGSPCYASPEMVAGKKYNGFKIDIWSTGVILYAMLCGYLPFEDKDNDILFEKILECKLIFPKYISKNAKDLIKKILVTDPDKRITIPEIKRHPFYLSGKELFEQDFSIDQINRDINDKNSSCKNIDLNNILDTPELKEKNNEKKIGLDTEDNKENVDDNRNNKNNHYKNKIKEIEIKLEESIYEKLNISNNNKNRIEEDDINGHKRIKTYELETINIEDNNKLISKNFDNKDPNNIKEKKINGSKSKGKSLNEKKISLLKESNKEEKKRLIKNARKLNIKAGPDRFKTNKKINEIIHNNKNFKKNLFQAKNADIISTLNPNKYLDKNAINKRVNFIRKKFNRFEELNQYNNINLENTNLNNNLNKINNTIDDNEMLNKKKGRMNLKKFNFTFVKNNKKAKSISKKNMKLTLFEAQKTKNTKKNNKRIYQVSTSIKRNKNKKFNLSNNFGKNNMNIIKYNLLHKKNLQEININLKKAKNIILSKEEKKIEKKNSKNKLINTNFTTIETTPSNNINMNIIENPENQLRPNTNTNTKKKIMKLNNKNIKRKLTKGDLIRKEKLFHKTVEQEKKEHHINKTSANLNTYLQNMIWKKTIDINDIKNNNKLNNKNNKENINKKSQIKAKKKFVNKSLNINTDLVNNKNYINNLTEKIDNIDTIENIIKTEPNQNKFTKMMNPNMRSNINKTNNKNIKENKNKFLFQVKLPIFNTNKKNKVFFKPKKENNINKSKIPTKHLNRTSHCNFHSFIQNPFSSHYQNSINKLFIKTNNGSFNQIEQNIGKKLNDKNNVNILNNNALKKKPLVSIRNTVINFNMIDSGLILDSIKRKKKEKKYYNSNNNYLQNNSANKLQNNHLFGLCNKFNNNISLNNNLLLKNDYILKKTKTLNNNIVGKKIFKYGTKINNNKLNNKKLTINNEKNHAKYNSMRLEELSGIKNKKKLSNINTNKIENTINDANKIINIELKHFNTINN